MPAIARIGDPCGCNDHVASGSPDVFVNNLPCARLDDATTGHDIHSPVVIIKGATTVFVNNKPAALSGISIIQAHPSQYPPGFFYQGAWYSNVITEASPNVNAD